MSKKTVGIYARVSTDKQTVDMQIHELKEYIKSRGWNLHREVFPNNPEMVENKRGYCKKGVEGRLKVLYNPNSVVASHYTIGEGPQADEGSRKSIPGIR